MQVNGYVLILVIVSGTLAQTQGPAMQLSDNSTYIPVGSNLSISCTGSDIGYLDWAKNGKRLSACTPTGPCNPTGSRFDVDHNTTMSMLHLYWLTYSDCGTYACKTRIGEKQHTLRLKESLTSVDLQELDTELSVTTNCLLSASNVDIRWYYVHQDDEPLVYDMPATRAESIDSCTGACAEDHVAIVSSTLNVPRDVKNSISVKLMARVTQGSEERLVTSSRQYHIESCPPSTILVAVWFLLVLTFLCLVVGIHSIVTVLLRNCKKPANPARKPTTSEGSPDSIEMGSNEAGSSDKSAENQGSSENAEQVNRDPSATKSEDEKVSDTDEKAQHGKLLLRMITKELVLSLASILITGIMFIFCLVRLIIDEPTVLGFSGKCHNRYHQLDLLAVVCFFLISVIVTVGTMYNNPFVRKLLEKKKGWKVKKDIEAHDVEKGEEASKDKTDDQSCFGRFKRSRQGKDVKEKKEDTGTDGEEDKCGEKAHESETQPLIESKDEVGNTEKVTANTEHEDVGGNTEETKGTDTGVTVSVPCISGFGHTAELLVDLGETAVIPGTFAVGKYPSWQLPSGKVLNYGKCKDILEEKDRIVWSDDKKGIKVQKVQVSDAGIYICFLPDGDVRTVKLNVILSTETVSVDPCSEQTLKASDEISRTYPLWRRTSRLNVELHPGSLKGGNTTWSENAKDLIIKNITKFDEGLYEVLDNNLIQRFNVVVSNDLVSDLNGKQYKVDRGSTVRLECSNQHEVYPSWERLESGVINIGGKQEFLSSSEKKSWSEDKCSLIIKEIQLDDTGTYICRHSDGTVESIILVVKGPLKVEKEKKKLLIRHNTCKVYPNLTLVGECKEDDTKETRDVVTYQNYKSDPKMYEPLGDTMGYIMAGTIAKYKRLECSSFRGCTKVYDIETDNKQESSHV